MFMVQSNLSVPYMNLLLSTVYKIIKSIILQAESGINTWREKSLEDFVSDHALAWEDYTLTVREIKFKATVKEFHVY